MPIKIVVLDCDGVILESVEVKTRAFGKLVEEHGQEAAYRLLEYHRENGGISRYGKFEWFYREVLGRDIRPDESEEMGRRFTRLCYEGVLAAPFVPGAEEFIRRYHDRLPLYVASGTPHDELNRIFRARGLTGFFKSVHGTPPEKNVLLARIVDASGFEPGEVLMVGDSSTDLQAALAVRTRFYGRGQSFADTKWPWSEDLHGLVRYLKSLNAV